MENEAGSAGLEQSTIQGELARTFSILSKIEGKLFNENNNLTAGLTPVKNDTISQLMRSVEEINSRLAEVDRVLNTIGK